jgi:hypothetical protein
LVPLPKEYVFVAEGTIFPEINEDPIIAVIPEIVDANTVANFLLDDPKSTVKLTAGERFEVVDIAQLPSKLDVEVPALILDTNKLPNLLEPTLTCIASK